MKHIEKLDLVLRALYGSRFEPDRQNFIYQVLYSIDGVGNKEEARIIAQRLSKEGLIKVFSSGEGFIGGLTSEGIEYCEASSYTEPEISLVDYNFEYLSDKAPSSSIKGYVNNLLEKHKPESALKYLKSQVEDDKEKLDTIALLLGQLTMTRGDYLDNLITRDVFKTELTRISMAIQLFCGDLE